MGHPVRCVMSEEFLVAKFEEVNQTAPYTLDHRQRRLHLAANARDGVSNSRVDEAVDELAGRTR